jgi:selenium donor protein
MKLPIYLDHNATTPLHPEVTEEMKPYLSGIFGNPSSTYIYGAQARTEVEKSRARVASLLGCKSHEVIFTSGGTESNNLAIKGIAAAHKGKGNHIITSRIEHPAVAEVCNYLERHGYRITRLDVDEHGLVSPGELAAAITSQTILVSIMHASNEIGTIQPIAEMAAICRERGIIMHTDAAQTAGKIPIDGLGADLISIAGHKLYGPKGVGALYIREGVRIDKIMHGADHEQNLRAGTENVMSIAGFGKACEVARRDMETNMKVMNKARDLLEWLLTEWAVNFWLTGQSKPDDNIEESNSNFWLTGQSKSDNNIEESSSNFWLTGRSKMNQHFPDQLPPLRFNGHPTHRLPNTLNVSFLGVDAGLLLPVIASQVAASAGAACHAAEVTLSPTLQAIQIPMEYAAGTVRFSTGRLTTREEVGFAVDTIVKALEKMLPNSTLSPFNHGGQGEIVDSGLSTVDFRKNVQSTIQSTIDNRQPTTDNSPLPLRACPDLSGGGAGGGVKLTHFTQGLGCACKLKPQLLQKVMAGLPVRKDTQVLVGPETFDDAAVYKISDELAIVQTVDFFTPVVDDPYDFGRIAAANALSDIYAMGATPLFALNIAGFPSTRLPHEVLQQILQGAADVAAEAGVSILGGHTVDDLEPKFGMAVTGMVHPDKILRNSTARPGDVLVLTKPLGTGILATALKRGLLDLMALKVLTDTMATLNKAAAEIMAKYPVSACTDVTGFGLLGHLFEMASASKVDAEVDAMAVPLLPRVEEFAAAGIVPGGSQANLDYVSGHVDWQDGISAIRRIILCDAQTSGGLLIAVPEPYAAEMAAEMKTAGLTAVAIGRIVSAGSGRVGVVSS